MDGIKSNRIYSVIRIATITTSIFLSACNFDPASKQIKSERIELYSMVEVNGEYQQGKMTFAESFVFDEAGNKTEHLIRQADNSLNREGYIYDNEVLTRSNYYDAGENLLSYYIYDYSNGRLKSKKAFDASSDELLRIDEYDYNQKGQLVKQYIKDSKGVTNRTMAFSYDQYGNEIQTTIRNAQGDIILNEEFKITEYDVNKRWLERWSVNNDVPLTSRKRVLDYY